LVYKAKLAVEVSRAIGVKLANRGLRAMSVKKENKA